MAPCAIRAATCPMCVAVDFNRFFDGVAHGHQHIGPRVAIRDREYIELVDHGVMLIEPVASSLRQAIAACATINCQKVVEKIVLP